MLRRELLGEGQRVAHRGDREDGPPRPAGLPNDCGPCGDQNKRVQGTRHEGGDLVGSGDQHAGCKRIMFGLRDQFTGDDAGVRRVVGDYEQLAGTCGGVDGHHPGNLELRFGDVGIARSDDAVHSRHRCRAVRHRRDGPRPADREHAIYAGEFGRSEQYRRGAAVARGRRADNDFAHPGHARRNRAHEQAAGVSRTTAGCVDSHAPQWIGPAPNPHSVHGLEFRGDRAERFMHRANVHGRAFERTAQSALERIERGAPCRPGYVEGV